VETFVQRLAAEAASFDDALERFDTVAGDLAGAGAVALKTIAAYRSGLRLAPVSAREAAQAWESVGLEARRVAKVRLEAKPLIDFFALRALGHAARQGMVLQVHTGYGDPDLDLREANPLHLRPVLEEVAYRGAAIVLLHGAYPYTREAAFLAAVYPHVYLDISTALPPLGASELAAMLGQALAVAPASKLLLSSDGARIPEHHVLGARAARRALGQALDEAQRNGELTAVEAEELAAWPLWRTARTVYGPIVQT
jgi:predicted TIM-barrel fold metal-dependent hydrolase